MRDKLLEIKDWACEQAAHAEGAYVHHFDTMAQCAQSLVHILDAEQDTTEAETQKVTALEQIEMARSEARAMLDAQIAKAMDGVQAEIEKAKEEARAEAIARINAAQTVEEVQRAWYDPRRWMSR